ncbi:sensor histidine kinase [Desulfosporosinus fructosivorans]
MFKRIREARRLKAKYVRHQKPLGLQECHHECEQQQELFCHHQEFVRKHREFTQYHKSLRFLRPVSIVFNLIILYLLFRWVGIKSISIFFAVFLIIKEVLQFSFLWRLEKRVFAPIDKLKVGVEEISRGNYNVKVERDIVTDLGFIGLLVDSFNEMAQKLQASEILKSEYEENRKTLIANISHDLKTPISSVQGYIEAIQDGVVISPEKIAKYLKTIYQNTVYMDKLIDDLFLFSKLDLQKLDFHFERVLIGAFMHDLMEEFQFELEEKQLNFHYVNKMESDCLVSIDRKRIHQAFRNVIGNAVKYGADKDLTIRIEMKRHLDSFIVINIADNGPGISAEKLPHIFNRFYRIDNERTKDLMSTGLGLAIAKELVQAHGGSITVVSIEKESTCFTILLPVIEEA